MSPARPIPTGSPGRRESIAVLASSLAASLADPTPLAHEALERDLADFDDATTDAASHDDLAHSQPHGRRPRLSFSYYSFGAAAGEDEDEDGMDASSSSAPSSSAPYLYRRPSAIAYGQTRPVLGVAPIEPPPLSRLERRISRAAERSLLRDNHILPPKHAGADNAAAHGGSGGGGGGGGGGHHVASAGAPGTTTPGPFRRLYKRLFSTKVPRPASAVDGADEELPHERTALLGNGGGGGDTDAAATTPGDAPLDVQWQAAVAAGQIHTTWQREAKTIGVYSRSLVITFLLQYSINITSIFAVGRIGTEELGAVSLAAMTASITFVAPVQGLATCLDTLCAQAYGSGHRTLVGLQLQRMCCFLLLLMLPLAAVWWNAAALLAALVPERHTAELAGLYLRIMIAGMPATAVFECAKRYMQAQGLFAANTYVLFIAAPLNILLNWFLVWHLGLGFVGAPLSNVLTQWLMPLVLLAYVLLIDGSECWGGFSWRRVFSHWGPMVRLALPGMIMIEAEYFAFEILTLASGRFGSTELAAQSILVTMTSTTYQLPFSLAIAASTRVANLTGARLPAAAKLSATVAVAAGLLIGLFNTAAVWALRYQIPRLFSSDPGVIALVAHATPICAFMQLFDGLSAVASGLLRGIGRQEIGGYANLAAYYLIALPISFATAFGLDWKLPGLWAGVTLGLFLVSVAEYWYLYYFDWQRAVDEAVLRNESG